MTARPLTTALTALTLATALVAMSAAPATAERWWGGDRSRDVAQLAFSPEPPPCGTVTESTAAQDATTDIVGLAVRHEQGSVELRAHFRDLTTWAGRHISFNLETDRRAYEVSVHQWKRRGPIEASLCEAAPPPESFDECGGYSTLQLGVPCPDLLLTRSPMQDTVTVTMPRSCLRGPRWVRAGLTTYRTVGDRYRSDVWSRSGTDPGPLAYAGPYGPRVRRD